MARGRYVDRKCIRCGKQLVGGGFCFCSPADAPRAQLRDRVRLTGDRLASAARVYLTLSTEYAKRETFRRQMAKPPSCVYPAWAKPTVQSRVRPAECFPEGGSDGNVARYVAAFDRLNHLRGVDVWGRERVA